MQQRHAEGVGLAHAGAGLADEIVACQRQGKGEFLNGKGVLNAVLCECADDFVTNAEFGKRVIELRHMRRR